MGNVLKEDGRTEDFNREKIERSVRNAGADERTAKDIARAVLERVVMTTRDIRKTVTDELKKRDPDAAKLYEDTRRFVAMEAIKSTKGTAQLTIEAMKRLNLKPGEPIVIRFDNKKSRLKAEKGAISSRNIELHEKDMKAIGVSDGTHVAVQRGK